ncbi:protein DEHYDRATION-INDUCED 19 homolog 4-like isoform X2 [Prosopis cineraria]|uniref:protein DEHYDRATION-INDUCED 19 homolog 4-like isoform X2 n=1 Tax=Prosopis cineraria TaxID=364024 RepID=UPI0024107FD0|nr:protein DEHYDRATION-INDUCED 19 homolog 4-like isoform X2 [Prosopis cineraria]
MDSDFWTSRLAAAKRQYAFQQQQSSQLDRLGIYDFVVEDDVRPDYSSSYEDVDIASLCSNLEDEHSCESRATVCPICSVKVARDMLSHITLQHGHLFKLQRRRRLRRVAVPSSQALSVLGRDLREAHLQVLLGSGGGGGSSGGYRSNSVNTSSAAATDPFLSSLIFNVPASEAEDISKSVLTGAEDSSPKNPAPSHIWKSSFDGSLSNEERERRMRQAAGRSGFVQDLFLSTLLGD